MRRTLIAVGLLLFCTAFSGCAICANSEDGRYNAYGGRWQRSDMEHGRVGSAFEPAGDSTIGETEVASPLPRDVLPPSPEIE